MDCIKAVKYILQFLLVIALIIVTYNRWVKLSREETSMSNSFEDSSFGIQLPSMTICYRAYEDYSTAPKMDETVTFKEFMETSKSVKDIIVKAELYVYGPNDRERQKYDFLEGEIADSFEESCYLVAKQEDYFGLNRCLTLNSPITESIIFKDAYVSKDEKLCFLLQNYFLYIECVV